MSTPNPEEDPILHEPWDEPNSYYKFNPDHVLDPPIYTEGRRPSQPSLADISRRKDDEQHLTQHDEPYATVNELRGYVAEWRSSGFRGTPAQKLLARWDDEAKDPHGDTRAYFCQREAVETIMWLFREYQDEALRKIAGRLREINATWNDGINRIAVKMATGAGKTRAMTMLIGCLEKMHPEGCTVVVINPNLTVQDRLQTIKEDVQKSEIVPRRDKSLTHATVHILNYHKFRQNDETFSGLGGTPSKIEKLVLGTKSKPESPKAMLTRLLGDDFAQKPLYVFQDEGHHCRRKDEQVLKGNLKEDEMDQEGQWYNALLLLRSECDLKAVIDFSATPAYLTTPKNLKSAVFPWIISDFGIEDAIESGICKIPRLPYDDDPETNQPGITNLYRHCIDEQKQKTKWGEEPPHEVKELMRALAKDWRENRLGAYSAVGRVPAVIVVVNSVHNAIVLYNWVSGSKQNEEWHAGAIEEFSNIDPTTNEPLPPADLPTIMAHSRIADGGDDLNSAAKNIIKGQKELRTPDMSEKESSDEIREIFSSVGVPGKKGERIRCVISVAMLSEGWDAKTVTHVFGFRRFSSVLLIEQVVGRALRRVSLDTPKDAEYAEVFGVPYPGLRRGTGNGGGTKCPVVATEVKDLDEKSQHRITWPNVKHIEITVPQGTRFSLVPDKVQPLEKLDIPEPVFIKLRDPTGHGEEHTITSTGIRKGRALCELAQSLSDLWLRSLSNPNEDNPSTTLNRRGILFCDAKRAIEEWLNHENIRIQEDQVRLLSDISLKDVIVQEIAACCVNEDGADSQLKPVFEEAGQKTSNTTNTKFTTTLRRIQQPLEKSHLSAAACHSSWEIDVSKALDEHPNIKSWVRNFRLDWRIPWWDTRMGTWREYEPDFVALTDEDDPHHLVIEVKGLEDPASLIKKTAAETWCEVLTSSEDAAGEGRWSYVYVTEPSKFMNQINQAVGLMK